MTKRKLISPGRLFAYAVTAIPVIALLVMGFVWLGQHGLGWTWAAALLSCSVFGTVLHRWLDRHQPTRLQLPTTEADPNWPARQRDAWAKIEAISNRVKPEDYPLTDVNGLVDLGRQTITAIAKYYNPEDQQPMLELSVPHLLRILELAARDLGRDVRDHVPFSHQLSIGDIVRVARLKGRAFEALDWWRLARPFFSLPSAIQSEIASHLQSLAFSGIQSQVQHWLLKEYVRRLGLYAIEVYSGRLRFSDEIPVPTIAIPADEPLILKPLEILVLGQTKAGKSSLVNALFGEVRAIADALPATSVFTSYWLAQTPEKLSARITDSPGLDTVPRDELVAAAAQADIILWVIPAHRADRSQDRIALDALRADADAHPERFPAPILAVLSNIDHLTPRDEWSPPYDLADLSRPKSRTISNVRATVASELSIAPDRLIPACLEHGRVYNVDETVWPALIKSEQDAAQVRLTRCLIEARHAEQKSILIAQLKQAAGKVWRLPSKAVGAITSSDGR